jgi:hypothetical protein
MTPRQRAYFCHVAEERIRAAEEAVKRASR